MLTEDELHTLRDIQRRLRWHTGRVVVAGQHRLGADELGLHPRRLVQDPRHAVLTRPSAAIGRHTPPRPRHARCSSGSTGVNRNAGWSRPEGCCQRFRLVCRMQPQDRP